jgi:hypothetical protein
MTDIVTTIAEKVATRLPPAVFLPREIRLKQRLIIILCLMLLAACAPLGPAGEPSATTAHTLPPIAATLPPTAAATLNPSPTPPPPGLTLDQLKNGAYILTSANNLKVTLKDGQFNTTESTGMVTAKGQMLGQAAIGDLDGDGVADAAIILVVDMGGSGTFHVLIAVLAQKGQAADLLLGDRVQENTLSIQAGKIVLDYVRQGPKDPMCCPSEHAQTTYQVQTGKLAVVSDQVLK